MSAGLYRDQTVRPEFYMSAAAPAARALPFVVFGLLLTLCLSWARLKAVWLDGAFFDSDDAMRLVQVRDFLNGQGWFDLSVRRLAAPDPMIMHWSRIIDVPLAALIRAFALFLTMDSAEKAARIVFPGVMFAGLFWAQIRLIRTVVGPGYELAVTILTALSGVLLVQFAPGRIDHHAPQILLLVLIVTSAVRSIQNQGVKDGLLMAFFASLSLAISLENLPFIITALGLVVLRGAIVGAAAEGALRGTGIGLPLFGLGFFFLTVAPDRYGAGTCDAFSTAHLEGMLFGGVGLLGLAAAASLLHNFKYRITASAVLGASVLALLYATFPACLGDPLAGIDPLLRSVWLNNVLEARPVTTLAREHPELLLPLVLPIFAGMPTAFYAVFASKGDERTKWIFVTGLIAAGCVTAFWQIRALSSLAPLSAVAGTWFVRHVRLSTIRWRSGVSQAAACAAALPFCAMIWAFAPGADAETADQAAAARNSACLEPSAIRSLDYLPAATILAPIDLGAHILALTHHTVIAAPYHRNNSGNLLEVRLFSGSPAEAEMAFAKSKATYLLTCPDLREMKRYAATEGSFARALNTEKPFNWLKIVKTGYLNFKLYEIP